MGPDTQPGRRQTRSMVHQTTTGDQATVQATVPRTPNRPTRSGDTDTTALSPSVRLSRLQIFNDSMPRSAQPETPQNLPEARHQSRLYGSYTVPARQESPLDIPGPATSRRWRTQPRQDQSPAGLQTPGFLGLYGGIENSDEVALYEEAERDHGNRSSRLEHGSSFGL